MLTTPKPKYEPKRTESTDKSVLIKPNLKGDWLNFFMLLLLYTMQGLPLGLSSAIPILLQSKKDTSYQDQVNLNILHIFINIYEIVYFTPLTFLFFFCRLCLV